MADGGALPQAHPMGEAGGDSRWPVSPALIRREDDARVEVGAHRTRMDTVRP
jgi:hypothetical protein